MFQSTHPRGVRLDVLDGTGPKPLFQSTHPRGVRRHSNLPDTCPFWFQSTHPRGVRRACTCTVSNATSAFQSTHPRGVRREHLLYAFRMRHVSIHAPAWGATDDLKPRGQTTGVSIHAPAWGATLLKILVSITLIMFQSTHPRGVRPPTVQILMDELNVSIHAPAWGATKNHSQTRRHCMCFNPRTRVGCDASSSANLLQGVEFQSTHPRGVRPSVE